MHPDSPLLSWLDHLWVLYPAQNVLVIGAGNGTSPWTDALQRWQAPSATLVEADEAQFQQLQHSPAAREGWHLRKQVIASETGSATFYTASNPAESGLIEPESLRALWPNLKTRQKTARQAISLTELLAATEPGANWLIIDCLTADDLLASTENGLAQLEVIVTRTLLPTNDAGTHSSGKPTPSAIQQTLEAQGFTQVATQQARNPGIAHTLLVRNHSACVRQLKAQFEQATQAAETESTRNQAARGLADAQIKQAQHQIKTLQDELANATAALQEANASKDQAASATQATLTQRETQLKALQAEIAKAREATQQAQDQKTQAQQQLAAAQTETAQWREATEKARAEATQLKTQALSVQATHAKQQEQQIRELKEQQAELNNASQRLQQAEQLNSELQQQITRLQNSLAEANQEREQLLKQLLTDIHAVKAAALTPPAPAAEPAESTKALLAATLANTSRLSEARQQIEIDLKSASAQNNELKTLLSSQKAAIDGLTQQVAQLSQATVFSTALEAPLAKQLAGTKECLKETETRLRNELSKGLGNAVKQVEAFLRIQNYLGSGDALGDFHGWPISPDIGLFLLEKMREQHYDLIIEFGSGTSTALFARALEVITQNRKHQIDNGASDSITTPTEIVSFEHDLHYHRKTSQMLNARRLHDRVQLVHAPLVDWSEGEQNYLYYDCQDTLSELAQRNADRRARILVLVDGPPGATCANARYPAVPLIFNVLGRHHIEVVLDDASRPEEKQVIEMWKSFWKQRSIRITESMVQSEKGIYIATPQS